MTTGSFILPGNPLADDTVPNQGDLIPAGDIVFSSDTQQRFQNNGTTKLGPVSYTHLRADET